MFATLLAFAVALSCVLEILVFAAAASFALGCVLEILVFAAAAFSLATLGFFTPPINGGAWPEVLVTAAAAAALVEDTDRALGIVSVVTNGHQAY